MRGALSCLGSQYCSAVSRGDLAGRSKFPYECPAQKTSNLNFQRHSRRNAFFVLWRPVHSSNTARDANLAIHCYEFAFFKTSKSALWVLPLGIQFVLITLTLLIACIISSPGKIPTVLVCKTLPRRLLRRPRKTRQIPVRVHCKKTPHFSMKSFKMALFLAQTNLNY